MWAAIAQIAMQVGGSIASSMIEGQETAKATNKKLQAYKAQLAKLQELNRQQERLTYDLTRKGAEAGLAKSKSNAEQQMQAQGNQANSAAMSSANQNQLQDTGYAEGYQEAVNNANAINQAKYNKELGDIQSALGKADQDFNVDQAKTQAKLNGISNAINLGSQIGGLFGNKKSTNPNLGKPMATDDDNKPTGAGATAASAILKSLSDVDSKSNLTPATIQDSLRQIDSVTYQYKPEYTPDNEEVGEPHVGTTAQSLEKTPLTKGAVVEGDGLKEVDIWKLNEAVTAGIAELQRQIDELNKESK